MSIRLISGGKTGGGGRVSSGGSVVMGMVNHGCVVGIPGTEEKIYEK